MIQYQVNSRMPFDVGKDINALTVKAANAINKRDWEDTKSVLDELAGLKEGATQDQLAKISELTGIYYHRINEWEKAKEEFRNALELEENAYLLFNAGLFWSDYGEPGYAERLFFRALEKKPDWEVVESSLGIAFQRQGRHCEADYFFRRYLSENPEDDRVREAYSMSLLSMGKFKEGWKEFESREKSWNLSWLNSDWKHGVELKGKRVVVIVDEGLGDAIMFSKLLPRLVESVEEHIVYCDRRLIGIMRRTYVNVNFESQVLDNRFREFDVRIRLGSLGGIFWNKMSDIERSGAFLETDRRLDEKWFNKLNVGSGRIKVGYAWKSANECRYEQKRKNISHNTLRQVFKDEKVELYSLQHQATATEIEQIEAVFDKKVHFFEDITLDIDELASLIKNLDLVICSEQTVAHIAGAVGKDCLVIGGNPIGWRYICGRNGKEETIESLWYNSVQVIRPDKRRLKELCVARVRKVLNNENAPVARYCYDMGGGYG